jgi:transglutaminase-like putative cysteine protease
MKGMKIHFELILFILLTLTSDAVAADRDDWHMEYELKERILYSETVNRYSPEENVKEYFPYAPIPPELAQQRQVFTTFAVNGHPFRVLTTTDQGPYHRLILMARIQAVTPYDHTNITVTVTYETTIYARRLKHGPGTNSVPVLSYADQSLALTNTKWLDFGSPEFTKWLRANNLQRQRQESVIAFGRRVCDFVHEHMTYNYPTSNDGKPLSDLCQVLKGHCGHYAMLFVGIMRANGVPARALVGHWLNAGPHIKSEFFVQGVGWVPVDATRGEFGREDGNFLTHHLEVEPLGLPNKSGGTWWSYYMQELYLPCDGGSWDKPKWTKHFTQTSVPLPSPPLPKAATAEPNSSTNQRLKELKQLFEQGLISQAVYDQKKKEIMDSL